MGFINPGKNNKSRIAGIRNRDRPSTPTSKGPRSPTPLRLFKRTHTTPRSSQDPTPRLSPFESLPVEILHTIFTHSFNLSLTRTSLHLTRTLAARHLQLEYVHVRHNDTAALSHVFNLRFFTPSFLELWEARSAQMLNCAGAHVPLRLVAAPWCAERIRLFVALMARGAALGESDESLVVLHAALVAVRVDVARALLDAGVRPDVESLRLAVRHTVGECGLEVCRILVGRGADVADVGVWREALGLRTGGEKVVGWLLEGAAPPGEVLGELSSR